MSNDTNFKNVKNPTIIDCESCHGSGWWIEEKCFKCHGNGIIYEWSDILERDTVVECNSCEGKGCQVCLDCNGLGWHY